MPLYDYECQECGKVFEKILPMRMSTWTQKCSCGGMGTRIMGLGHGGIQCDSNTDVKWLPSAVENLLPDGSSHRIETRGQFNRYLKDHNIVERGDTQAL